MSLYEQALQAVERPQKLSGLKSATFWRQDPPVLDANRKVIKGGMWPKQREWWHLKNFVKIFVGGYGAGKTNLVPGKRCISSALQNAPCPVGIVSPSFPLAKKTVIPTVSDLLEGKRRIYGRDFYWSFNQSSPPTFTVRFHGREGKIHIFSGEKPLSLRGSNLAAAYIDEPFIQDAEVFKQMVARVRHPDAKLKEIGLAGTPEQLNWGYDLCTHGEEYEKLDVGVIHSSTRDNLALEDQYVRNLEGAYDERAAKAFIEGEFINLSKGQVYYSFDPHENLVHMDRPFGASLGFGMDFNVNPMAFAVFWVFNDHMHFFKEYELANSDTEFACQLLREDFPDMIDAFPDPSGRARHTNAPGGKTDFHYLQQAGFRVNARQPGEPAIKDRYNAVNGKFKPRSGLTTLTVDPACKRLANYLSTYTHEGINKPEQKAKSHLLDAFSYPVEYLFPAKKDLLIQRKLVGV